MNYKDIATRALKTFIQAFIPVVISAFATADLTELSNIKAVGYSALISGAAAGISAVWNLILKWLDVKLDDITTVEEIEDEDVD